MKILLEHPITEPPKTSGIYWFKSGPTMQKKFIFIGTIDRWNESGWHPQYDCWYEEITLPDDTIIAQ